MDRLVGVGAGVRVYCSLSDPTHETILPGLWNWLKARRRKKSKAAADHWFCGHVSQVSNGDIVEIMCESPALGVQPEVAYYSNHWALCLNNVLYPEQCVRYALSNLCAFP